MPRRFVILDVFTQTPLAGNPLAVVLDAEGLDGAAMQAIAREFNLSETVFVLPPAEARHRARLRIFTPTRELPFAGHPTVGSAVLLALRDRRADLADAVAFGLEVELGVVPCVVEAGENRGRARFKLPVMPDFRGDGPDAAPLAAALGLEPGDIGFGRHRPSRHAAGPEFTFVPVASRARLDAAKAGAGLPEIADAVYLYAPDPEGLGLRFQSRMLAPALGVPEDPATGSAAAAFAGVLMQFETLGEGTHDVAIRQGVAMGRPSEIDLQVEVAAGALRSVEIGGAAVVVADGSLHV
ncbi:PhzF family phenazine biosynthesis protein [Methylobacterium dankookense]|uniref:Trans-2,3-dihydro-3-hydroxyanthranilate isomerase n=1 Tax=Methylobacterium dankookense TaxID=560405 RepID=A0A564FS20_9HYPH|nr:PhzF family phenazine biosynthesis protein [Methylobacterium dankookense]GJD57834.1 Trans-2,3-dihydro-3-hydroxyanthranilate isomerase [Methylobacterium dankookense]VUF10530.1 Trans-2,3-dihydro-3-hydroxyanthranilate isomerase [Methylobacterium dankookense]